jgi:hypothetical protein
MRASVAIMQCMVQMVEHLVSRDNLLVSANKLNVDFVEKRARWEEDLFRRWIVYVPLNLHTKFSMDALSRPLIFINTQNGIIQTCYKKQMPISCFRRDNLQTRNWKSQLRE